MTETITESPDSQEKRQYERKVLAPVPVEALRFEPVPADAPPIQVRDSTRSEEQRTVDRQVWAAYQAWLRLPEPRPVEFNRMPRYRYVVAPEHADAVRTMLDRAGTFHGINVRKAPTKRHSDGSAIIYFSARARTKRNRNTEDFPDPETDS